MEGPIDINKVLASGSVITITPEENAADRTARLDAAERWNRWDLTKQRYVFFVLMSGLVAIGVGCAYTSFLDAAASPDSKRWAQTVLSSLVTGAISFVVGQMTRPKS